MVLLALRSENENIERSAFYIHGCKRDEISNCFLPELTLSGASVIFCYLQELPKLVDGGADPVAQDEEVIEEEEFDLADIMGEEVEQSISTEDRLKQVLY